MQRASVAIPWRRSRWWWCCCWWWWCCCCWWCPGVAAWNTTRLYGTPLRARLTDVAVWRNRAYACWPRLDAAQPVTLLELPWPETEERRQQRRRVQRQPYPSSAATWKPRGPFRADQQKLYDCQHVQSAVALDLDRIRGHLYVLDSGYDSACCQPKIVVYDLKTSRCIHWIELDGLNGSELTGLTVDARPVRGETRAYAGNARGGYLAAFDPARMVWHRVALSREPQHQHQQQQQQQQQQQRDEIDYAPSECVAVSKSHSSVFFTSRRSHNFYAASLRDLRNLTSYVTPGLKNGDALRAGLRVRWAGVKLGRSSGLYADVQGGLNYVYTRDFVAVRLPGAAGFVPGTTAAATAAEDHEVLLQSYDLLPAVTKIFTDNANRRLIWALNAVPNAENRHSVKIHTLAL